MARVVAPLAALALCAAAPPKKAERDLPLSPLEKESLAAGEKALPRLHRELKSPAPRKRFEAAVLLAWLGGPESRGPVAAALATEKDAAARQAMGFALDALLLDAQDPLTPGERGDLATRLVETSLKTLFGVREPSDRLLKFIADAKLLKASPLDVPAGFALKVSGPRQPRRGQSAFSVKVHAADTHEAFLGKLRSELVNGVRFTFHASGDLASASADLWDAQQGRFDHPRLTALFRKAGGRWVLLDYSPELFYGVCSSNTCVQRPYRASTARPDPVERRRLEMTLDHLRQSVAPDWTDQMFALDLEGERLDASLLPTLERHRDEPDAMLRAAVECAIAEVSKRPVRTGPVFEALEKTKDDAVRRRALFCLGPEAAVPLEVALELASSAADDVSWRAFGSVREAAAKAAEDASEAELERISNLATSSLLSRLVSCWARTGARDSKDRWANAMDPLVQAGLDRRGREITEREAAPLLASAEVKKELPFQRARIWGDFAAVSTRATVRGCTNVLVRQGGAWRQLSGGCWRK